MRGWFRSRAGRRERSSGEAFGCPLVPCSSQREETNPREVSTIAQTTTTTTTITIIAPIENPRHNVYIYLCINTPSNKDYPLSWCKIDPTHEEVVAEPKPAITISPISYTPNIMPSKFRLIPSQHSNMVYALGGITYPQLGSGRLRGSGHLRGFGRLRGCGRLHASRSPLNFASVCDFDSNNFVWKQLPPMISPKIVDIGVASPDGKIYAFGDDSGEVFDPLLGSWSTCPCFPSTTLIDDYTVAKDLNQLFVFTDSKKAHTFDFFTRKWNFALPAHVTPPKPLASRQVTSSVAVGDFIYKFHYGKLYALDTTIPQPSFETVQGLDQYLPPSFTNHETGHKIYLIYIGKGKLCLIKGATQFNKPEDALFITCVKFWIGKCNRDNQWHAIFDRCEEYVTQGFELYDCFGLQEDEVASNVLQLS